jgi:feruloyl-CoA synthase
MAEALRDSGTRLRPVRLGHPACEVERKADGTIYLRSTQALAPYPDKITERLVHWASAAPLRVFLAQRDASGSWRTLTYAQALAQARSIGAALLRRGLSVERPVAILSGNDIEHALLGLACLYVGIPYAPVSPAYSLLATDFAKLRAIVNLLQPGLIFVSDGAPFARALAAVGTDAEIVAVRDLPPGATSFTALAADHGANDADAAYARVTRDTIAKFLFTSGSTGQPKGVINTHGMWCANQMMIRTAMAFFADEPPVIVDWAPWHHTAGGNHDFGLVLFNGGSFYIDEGKPLPGAIETTVRNLREIAPTWYFNVPKGYEALLTYFRSDRTLRENFFSRLKVLFYAGAGASQHVLDEMQRLSVETCGERILFLTSLGATETAPFAIVRTWDTDRAGNIGLPGAGLTLKLVPAGARYEARLKGPNITPGYWRAPELTAQAFDEEGFYRLGDALSFADPADPKAGLFFEGRIAEDFKLASGTWVHVGPLRTHLLHALAPYARDAVIAAPDADFLGALIFPDLAACRALCPGLAADARAEAVVEDERVRREFRQRLAALAAQSPGSSERIERAILVAEPPSLDHGEATDKGSINQRAVLTRRAALVADLYKDPVPGHVITAK